MVASANQPIVHIGSATTSADWDGRDTSFSPKINQLSADADLQKTLHLQMKEGRWFQASSPADRHAFILNETAVRELGIRTPVIGQRFSLHGSSGLIIGIVKDFNYQSLHEKTGSLVVFNNPDWYHFFMIRTAPHRVSQAVQAVTDTWKKILPGTPLEYSFLDDRFNDIYRQDQKISTLIFAFAAIAVIISAMGLFGLAVFAAEQRTKEIGIRKVLGATMASISILLSKDFIKLVIISLLIAFPVAWWATSQWLENFAYRISISWWMFALAGVLALLIALLVTSYHAIKASMTNPVKSLRTD